MAKNPFQPAEKIAKKLKVLIYGASGSGKTRAGLTFPRPAVIDTENGTDLYAGRPGVPEFSVLRAKTLSEVESAVAFIREDNGRTFDTLIIDAITVLYDVQKDAAAKNGKDGEMNPRLWNRINGRMVALYNSLTNLPVHVVVIARESELYEGEGLNLKKTGTKPDADKKIPYMFDFVVRMKADHSGEIVKSRGVNVGSTMPTVNWQAFEKAAGLFSDGTQASALSDEQAVNTDARAYQDAPPQSSRQPAEAVVTLSSQDASTWAKFIEWVHGKFGYEQDRIEHILATRFLTVDGEFTGRREALIGAVLAAYCGYVKEEIAAVGPEKKLSDTVIDFAKKTPAPDEIPF